MWQLPPLRWQHAQWRLTLRAEQSCQFALALIAAGEDQLRRLANLLVRSPELVLWSLCRGSAWQDRPPGSPEELAGWLADYLHGDEPFELSPREAAPLLAEDPEPYPAILASGPAWSVELLQPSWLSLTELWESTTGDLRPPFDEIPWLPLWLRSRLPTSPLADPPSVTVTLPADDPLAEEDDVETADQEDALASSGGAAPSGDTGMRELAGMLPDLVLRARRLARIEQDFAGQLEREKLAAMRELAYGASHEINNPLANIATRAQTLLREDPDPDRKQKLATIAAQAFRAYEMIADLMLFAKPPTPQYQCVRVDQLIEQVLAETRDDAVAQGTSVRWPRSHSLMEVEADPAQLAAAIKALVRNALEAVATGGTVEVRCEWHTLLPGQVPGLAILVRDSGPGIPAEVRRHLFDPFYSGREAGRGLGFGLSKCWRIAELHGGRVEVASEPGFGATFTLSIPLRVNAR